MQRCVETEVLSAPSGRVKRASIDAEQTFPTMDSEPVWTWDKDADPWEDLSNATLFEMVAEELALLDDLAPPPGDSRLKPRTSHGALL